MNRVGSRPIILAALAAASVATTSLSAAAASPSDKLVLKSTVAVDYQKHTATLPLYHGVQAGKSIWYIVTDASDPNEARKLRVVFSPNLATIGDAALQQVSKRGNDYVFEGAPDFSPTRTYVSGKAGFPPASAAPGAVGDSKYSPFVRVDGIAGVLNAPIVATGDGSFDVVHHTNTCDCVVGIDTRAKTVTLVLTRGFVDGKLVDYLSTEASDPGAAALARATYAPKLKYAKLSATLPIGVVVNGSRNADAPQGLAFLALDTPLGQDVTPDNVSTIGSPFNILASAPSESNPYAPSSYSPLWDAYVVPKGPAGQIKDYAAFAKLQPKRAGFNVNCPVVNYE